MIGARVDGVELGIWAKVRGQGGALDLPGGVPFGGARRMGWFWATASGIRGERSRAKPGTGFQGFRVQRDWVTASTMPATMRPARMAKAIFHALHGRSPCTLPVWPLTTKR